MFVLVGETVLGQHVLLKNAHNFHPSLVRNELNHRIMMTKFWGGVVLELAVRAIEHNSLIYNMSNVYKASYQSKLLP